MTACQQSADSWLYRNKDSCYCVASSSVLETCRFLPLRRKLTPAHGSDIKAGDCAVPSLPFSHSPGPHKNTELFIYLLNLRVAFEIILFLFVRRRHDSRCSRKLSVCDVTFGSVMLSNAAPHFEESGVSKHFGVKISCSMSFTLQNSRCIFLFDVIV